MASDGEGSRYDLPLWCSVASGTVGGACAVVVGYPFETIKVRLQTGATQRMWSQLFAGMGAPLATVTPQWAVMYAAYYNVQKYLGDKELGPVARGAVSGAACGFAVSFCAVPVDVVKINAQKMHVSAYESMRTLYKQRGLRFVAHGGVATVLHLTLSQMAFFATYELVLDVVGAAAGPRAGRGRRPERAGRVDAVHGDGHGQDARAGGGAGRVVRRCVADALAVRGAARLLPGLRARRAARRARERDVVLRHRGGEPAHPRVPGGGGVECGGSGLCKCCVLVCLCLSHMI